MKAQLIIDFKQDSVVMNGAITRAGPFEYSEGLLYKDWDNLVEVFSKMDSLPVIGSKLNDSHLDIEDRRIGYAHNFTFNNETRQVFADIQLDDDIENLSDLYRPNDLPVSIGFEDTSNTDTQKIRKVHHLAMSLNATEKDRCSTADGKPCRVSIKKTDSVDAGRSSSQETDGTRKIIKQQQEDSMGILSKDEKDDNEKEITEDTQDREDAVSKPATPDNLGTETWNVEQNTKSAKKAFMLDCQQHGFKSPGACEKAWTALNDSPASPIKSEDKSQESKMDESQGKDFQHLEEKISRIENVLGDFANILPTLTEVVQDKSRNKAEEMIQMKDFLEDKGFCRDMLDDIKDYDEMHKFYERALTNRNIVREDTAEEIRNANTPKLLGKRKKDQEDFEDMMAEAKKDGRNRLYRKETQQNNVMDMLKNALGGSS